MSGSSQTSSGWILDALKRNPEGFLLLAAGAVLMLRHTSLPRAVASVGREGAAVVGDTPAANIPGSVSKIAEQDKQKASSYASAATDYAGQVGRTISDQSSRITGQAQSVLQSTIKRVVQDQPLTIALAGLAAGAAIAAAFPTTEIERQTLGPIGERVSEAAEQIGGQLKQAAANAGETLKQTANERGLNTDGLKEVTSEVASAFSSTMSGKPEVRNQDSFRGPNDPPATANR
jgi:hypothetical protein